MKAAVYKKYGPPEVLELREVPKPTPGKNQVLIRVHATTVTAGDWRMRKADPVAVRLLNGLDRPRLVTILGMELAGEIEAVGHKVQLLKPGDRVFAATGFRMGAYAEYKCLSERAAIAHKPANITYEEAAAIPIGGITALYYLRDKGKMPDASPGQKVLIYGASGSVGTYAVQLARYYDAEVTGVCSTANIELVKSLGAKKVIDYTMENFLDADERYDIVFDAVGKVNYSDCRRLLAPKGKFLTVNKGLARGSIENLLFYKELIEKGKIKVVIDRLFKFDQIVEAHEYVEKGHKKGNVSVKVT